MNNAPAWLYHKDHPPRIFQTCEAVEDAGVHGWVDSPAKAVEQAEEQSAEEAPSNDKPWLEMTVKELRAFAKEAGVELPREANRKDEIIAILERA